MFTDDEAKEKWCPMARVQYDDRFEGYGYSHNRMEESDKIPKHSHCIGSKCMLWRETPSMQNKEKTGRCGLGRA